MLGRLIGRDRFEITRKQWRRRSQYIISKLSPYALNALLMLQTKMTLNPDLEEADSIGVEDLFLESTFTVADAVVLQILGLLLSFVYAAVTLATPAACCACSCLLYSAL